jgi:hypothetical protein
MTNSDHAINYDLPDEGPEMEPREPSATCPRCGCEVDPTTCYCGDSIDGRAHDNHYAVPQGCRCHERPIDLEPGAMDRGDGMEF